MGKAEVKFAMQLRGRVLSGDTERLASSQGREELGRQAQASSGYTDLEKCSPCHRLLPG